MDYPNVLYFFAEKFGKPISAFTKADWRKAAIAAAIYFERTSPIPKKRGRPRNRPKGLLSLRDLVRVRYPTPVITQTIKNPIGRPRSTYGNAGLGIECVRDIFDAIRAPEVRAKWPNNAPKSDIEAMKSVLRVIGHQAGHAESVLRAIRRERADKLKK